MIVAIVMLQNQSKGQHVQITKEQLLALTPEWKGDRFADGRPRVPDNIIQRMKAVSVEEAWAVMKNAGYGYQVAEGWQVINPDSVLVGRAVTATFMPARPDVWKAIDSVGKKEGKRGQNTWAVDLLVKGDVYVADQFGAHKNGPTIGDNVGSAIYAKSGNGIVYERGVMIGKAKMSQVSVGFQLGGQAYRELIFFENQESLDRFKKNKFEFSAQASAVAAKAGASANAQYRDGVMIYTQQKGGLMYEASVGGQKFKFTAF